jgi:hypothetical protein
MKFLVVLMSLFSFSAHAQFDGRGHPGRVLRAYIKADAKLSETMVPGTEHVRDSEAVYPTTDVTVVTQTILKIVGKGVKVHTGEGVAFACIGAQIEENSLSPSCDYLRAIYYNPTTNKVFAFGQIYYAGDTNLKSFFESLKETWQQVHSPKVTVNKFIAFYSEELTSKDGWNWSSSPSKIPYGRFLSIVADLQGAVLECYTKVKGMIFVEMIQPNHPTIFSPWYSSSGGYGPNGGYYSVYDR